MELHLFIIWEKAQFARQKIVSDIEKDLEILKILDVNWSKEKFSENLTTFYGQKLPSGSFKEKECGSGMFSIVVVQDHHPRYEERNTTHGPEVVNVNMFDRKEKYRSWTWDNSIPRRHKCTRIHGTNSEQEFRHDLMILTGYTVEEFLREKDHIPNVINQNVVGVDGWKSLEEIFKVLNECEPYVVLRNFALLPSQAGFEEHGDIDLLVENEKNVAFLLHAKKVFCFDFRVQYTVNIGNDYVTFDIRSVGDNYYPGKWEEHILAKREMNENKIFIPQREDYVYSLLYHAVFQKPAISQTYINEFQTVLDSSEDYVSIMEKYLKEHDYQFCIPKDKSVYINADNTNCKVGFDRILYRLFFLIERKVKSV